ncbi:hypothetical protein [Mesorhizobium sp. LSJC265A00]|uniref:hypothetical protein n=1 Tax=Mesorhizobium sp. LSJC265A00 TaxID=1287322 RepID=UPI0012EBB31C|nr:hypothetical protein [Mesorhizobium sp. LSJC265A00]
MRGTSPPAEKCITFASDVFLNFPQLRCSLSHMRELLPTVSVWRGLGQATRLDGNPAGANIEAITFVDSNAKVRTFDQALRDTYTDGIVVRHRGA